jgi:hypothetical protein
MAEHEGDTGSTSGPAAAGAVRWPLAVTAGIVVVAVVATLFVVLTGKPVPTGSASPTTAGTTAPSGPDSPSTSADPTSKPVTPAPTQPSPSPTKVTTSAINPEAPPVGLGDESDPAPGIIIELSSIEKVDGVATRPGEVAGPSLRLTILVRNGSDKEIDLGAVVVNGYHGEDRTPLNTISSPGGAPFHGTLAPGSQADAVYLFVVPNGQRSDVTFTVQATGTMPAAVFRGDAR